MRHTGVHGLTEKIENGEKVLINFWSDGSSTCQMMDLSLRVCGTRGLFNQGSITLFSLNLAQKETIDFCENYLKSLKFQEKPIIDVKPTTLVYLVGGNVRNVSSGALQPSALLATLGL